MRVLELVFPYNNLGAPLPNAIAAPILS
jgi:hypothetical protein